VGPANGRQSTGARLDRSDDCQIGDRHCLIAWPIHLRRGRMTNSSPSLVTSMRVAVCTSRTTQTTRYFTQASFRLLRVSKSSPWLTWYTIARFPGAWSVLPLISVGVFFAGCVVPLACCLLPVVAVLAPVPAAARAGRVDGDASGPYSTGAPSAGGPSACEPASRGDAVITRRSPRGPGGSSLGLRDRDPDVVRAGGQFFSASGRSPSRRRRFILRSASVHSSPTSGARGRRRRFRRPCW